MNTRQYIFLSLYQLESHSHPFCYWIVWPHSTTWTNWNNHEEVQVTRTYVFKRRFRWRCRLGFLKSLLVLQHSIENHYFIDATTLLQFFFFLLFAAIVVLLLLHFTWFQVTTENIWYVINMALDRNTISDGWDGCGESTRLTNVARVRFPDSASKVGWVCCCSERFFSGFPLSSKIESPTALLLNTLTLK